MENGLNFWLAKRITLVQKGVTSMTMDEEKARRRIIIEGLQPEIDGGRYPIKRVIGEQVLVEVDLVADGHDVLAGMLCFRHLDDADWTEVPLEALVNDRWRSSFSVDRLGRYAYTIVAWVDRFATWQHGIKKKVEAGQDIDIDLRIGSALIREAAERATPSASKKLLHRSEEIEDRSIDQYRRSALSLEGSLTQLMADHPDRRWASRYPQDLMVVVDPPKASFCAWYEMFPRSCADNPGQHGTFKDCKKRLEYLSSLGFDIVYLPPIHPIGVSHRKGKNNSTTCLATDPGSPWAIGSSLGGHKSIHPELGTLDDFRRFIKDAKRQGLDVALDIAFQCSPDHPYVKEHPEWFRIRPDGTVQYAENPPKKYQDIYPLEFATEDWKSLWLELKSIFDFWIEQGVTIFRVDNPHTKPFAFWEWMITEIKAQHPEVIFLSEAFTRPKIMYALAKLGFTQSYTYFTWRNSRWELTEYLTELTQTQVREFFRPNLWPNTPDILHETLQRGGRPAFISRFVLASTLSSSYGIYGPSFELCINTPREQGSEEYLDSEKYEIKSWDLESEGNIRDIISRVNQIRKQYSALHTNQNLVFHQTDNEQLICYSKQAENGGNTLLMVVNLDSQGLQRGFTDLWLEKLGLAHDQEYGVHDLLTGERYRWMGGRNYIELDPHKLPAHILLIEK